MAFSDRYGFRQRQTEIQYKAMDEPLRTALWNVVYACSVPAIITYWGTNYEVWRDTQIVWAGFFGKALSDLPIGPDDFVQDIKALIMEDEWYTVYDFIEYISRLSLRGWYVPEGFEAAINRALERERSAYRLRECQIIPITNETELKAIESALSDAKAHGLGAVNKHLQDALSCLSKKPQPDAKGCMREAIHSLESLCKIISLKRDATLNDALNAIQSKKLLQLPQPFKDALSKLYSYTNSTDGIRHAELGNAVVTDDDARFFLVSCTAFVSYLIAKSREAGINLGANAKTLQGG